MGRRLVPTPSPQGRGNAALDEDAGTFPISNQCMWTTAYYGPKHFLYKKEDIPEEEWAEMESDAKTGKQLKLPNSLEKQIPEELRAIYQEFLEWEHSKEQKRKNGGGKVSMHPPKDLEIKMKKFKSWVHDNEDFAARPPNIGERIKDTKIEEMINDLGPGKMHFDEQSLGDQIGNLFSKDAVHAALGHPQRGCKQLRDPSNAGGSSGLKALAPLKTEHTYQQHMEDSLQAALNNEEVPRDLIKQSPYPWPDDIRESEMPFWNTHQLIRTEPPKVHEARMPQRTPKTKKSNHVSLFKQRREPGLHRANVQSSKDGNSPELIEWIGQA